MRTPFSCMAAAVLAASLLVGTEAQAGHSRENPVVSAVKTAHNSIVTIHVEKHGAYHSRAVSGTGVIVDARGYVLTNCHVVNGGDNPIAILADGSSSRGRNRLHRRRPRHGRRQPAGRHEVSGNDLGAGQRPDGRRGSDRHRPSLRLHQHRFHGHRQRLNREVSMQSGGVLTNLIQTTASINPGNSGGPLMNINGELIGINSAMRADAQGIAFALNADMVQQVLSQQLSAGRMAHVSARPDLP